MSCVVIERWSRNAGFAGAAATFSLLEDGEAFPARAARPPPHLEPCRMTTTAKEQSGWRTAVIMAWVVAGMAQVLFTLGACVTPDWPWIIAELVVFTGAGVAISRRVRPGWQRQSQPELNCWKGTRKYIKDCESNFPRQPYKIARDFGSINPGQNWKQTGSNFPSPDTV